MAKMTVPHIHCDLAEIECSYDAAMGHIEEEFRKLLGAYEGLAREWAKGTRHAIDPMASLVAGNIQTTTENAKAALRIIERMR